MRYKQMSVVAIIWILIVFGFVGFGSLGAQEPPISQAVSFAPDLVVEPPVPWHSPICAGDRQRYTLTFTNKSSKTLTGVSATDFLPEVCPAGCDVCAWNNNNWPYDDCSPGAVYDDQRTVRWNLDPMQPGDTINLYLEVRFWSHVPDGQVLENCLTVASDQSDPETACSSVVVRQCVTPTATATTVPTNTPMPTPSSTPGTPLASATPTLTPGTPSGTHTPTFTPGTPAASSTPTSTPGTQVTATPTVVALFKLYVPDIYANHVLVTPTQTPTSLPATTPTPTATPGAPVVQCIASAPGVGLIYRIDPSLFRGYPNDSSSSYPLSLITSPPAPTGWNQPGFVPGSGWRAPVEVWWPAWGTLDWAVMFPAKIIGLNNSRGRPEGIDGTTHLIWQSFTLAPPEPGMHIVNAVLDMWSDNKTAWYWEGELVESNRQLSVSNHLLYPDHVSAPGGTYLLAIQNSNDYMRVQNPQGTAYRVCVSWTR